ncbi:MAG TPA: hypothetical protein VFR37_08765 [Longimicrobium sp.]|nr:hypothetical protein [Longimicrobium sp.]
MIESPREAGRTEMWLPLLRRLTAGSPTWAVWKNVDSALLGHGDVDSLADPGCWPGIEAEFRAWAAEHGLDRVIACRHVPQGPHLLAFGPGTRHLVQLDVKERATFRGSTLVSWRTLLPLCEMDPRGFRRVRPGAEGVIKLLSNGLLPGGRMDGAALRKKRVAELLNADPEGVRLIAGRFGPAAGALRRGAEAAARGGWDRQAMRMVEAWCLLRAIAEPGTMLSRIGFKYHGRKRCPVIRTIRRDDRRIPDDVEGWMREVRRTHPGGVSA